MDDKTVTNNSNVPQNNTTGSPATQPNPQTLNQTPGQSAAIPSQPVSSLDSVAMQPGQTNQVNEILPSPSLPPETATQQVPQQFSQNAIPSQEQPLQASPVSQSQTVFQGQYTPSPSQTTVDPAPNTPSTLKPQEDPAPRITMQDLYGPSTTAEEKTTPTSSPPREPFPRVLPAEPVSDETSKPQEITQDEESATSSIPQEGTFHQDEEEPSPPHSSIASSASDSGEGKPFPLHSIFKLVIGLLFLLLIVFGIFSLFSALFNKSGTGGQVTLTYWGLWEDTAVMQPILDDFHKQYPNITVEYSKQDPKEYTDRLLTRMQNGTGPDIFRFHNTWVTPLENVLAPLPQQVISRTDFESNYYPFIRQDLVKNGAILGLPLGIDTLALYVNKAIFDHAGITVPTNWDDFVTAAKALTVKDATGKIKTSGSSLGTYDNITHAPDIISLLLIQNGANYRKLDQSQNAIDTLTFYTSFAKGDANVWDSTLDPSLVAFSRGKVAMYFGYSWDYFAIKALAPDLQFEVHPVPHLSGRTMTIASYWAEGVSSQSKHQKEAFTFLHYLAQKDTLTKLYSEEAKTRPFGEIYPRADLADSLMSNQFLSPFVSQAKNAVSSIFAADTFYTSFNGSLNQYLGNAINSILGNTSVESATTTLSQGVQSVFSPYEQKTP